jgi:hypothetical protein
MVKLKSALFAEQFFRLEMQTAPHTLLNTVRTLAEIKLEPNTKKFHVSNAGNSSSQGEMGICFAQRSVPHNTKKKITSHLVRLLQIKKIAQFCCGTIHRCLRVKTDTTALLLGYTTKELKNNLEKHFSDGMSWENYGKGKNQWSIDHTKPISTFKKDASIMEINALENLRPMWHTQNCSKKNKWEVQ